MDRFTSARHFMTTFRSRFVRVFALAVACGTADAAAGQTVFKKCAACHTVDKGGANRVGPNLWGVVGAGLGQVAGYAYSKALKAKGGTWDYESLNAWLASPKTFMPGTKMTFAGVKKVEERANLIAYLRGLADTPLPLPEAAAAPATTTDAATTTVEVATTAPATTTETAAPAPAAPTAAAPAGGALGDLLRTADAAAGGKVAAKCKACHDFSNGGKSKVGPPLWDIVGASQARTAGFAYSGAMKGLGKQWTYEELDKFLNGPKNYAPGTKMVFAGIKKPEDRAALIAYLRSLSDTPKPLP